MTLPDRVGINALFLEPGMGGLETYVKALVGELVQLTPSTRFTLLANREGRRELEAQAWAHEVRFRTPRVLSRRGLRMATELALLGGLASEAFDVLHSPALTAPLRTRAANVVVVADVTWIVAPTGGAEVGPTEALWRAAVPAVARRADRVVAISQDGARQIVDRLRVPAERIDVIPLGSSRAPADAPAPSGAVRRKLGLGEGPLVLSVGAIKRHKNHAALIRALPAIRDVHPDAQLVLVGAPTPYEEELRAEARSLGVDGATVFCGYVGHDDLEALYSAAGCFAFPSLNEGFGLPVLEAMERGVAVACANVSAAPEVAGDAALLFDPHDPVDGADAIGRLLSDSALRGRLVRAGRARARGFTWRATAELTLESWERALAAGR